MMQNYKQLLNSMKVNKEEFKLIAILNAAFFLIFYLVAELFGRLFTTISNKITSVTGIEDIASASEEAISGLTSVNNYLVLVVVLVTIFIISEIYLYSYFENRIWNTIFKRKTTLKNTNRFMVFNILLSAILSLIVFAIFLAIANLKGDLIKPGVAIFYLSAAVAIYLMFVGYSSFGKTQEIIKSIKSAFTIGLGRFDIMIWPLVAAVIVNIVLNLGLMLFRWLPVLPNTILQGAVFAAYLAWFRIYLANMLKSVKL